ncbi:uncharacterized protein JCM10292_006061 [Rhodotorula paludigena]|uniref:uncharacterized protein n=1 Tax=Rhodotorula paludigena TaxID=86838 RepID=UPI003174A31B
MNAFEIKGLPNLALLPPVLQSWSFHKVERLDTVFRIVDSKPTDGDYLYHTEWRLVRQNGHHADGISAFHLTWKVNAFMQHTAEQKRLQTLPAGTLVIPSHVNDDDQECFTLHSLLVVFGMEAPPSGHEPQARRVSSASTVRPSHADVLDPLSLIGTGDSQAPLV